MLTAGVTLYADFQAKRLEPAELSPHAASTNPHDADRPPPSIQKSAAAGSDETTDSSPREIHCPDPEGPDEDCLLYPLAPECQPADTPSKPPPTPGPPLRGLSPREITTGIQGIKPGVEKCGTGAKVAIKFAVDGSTGTVMSATPIDENATTPLGKCVAKAAKHAQFPKFPAPRQNFTFKFRL
jgi:hypothetical protein